MNGFADKSNIMRYLRDPLSQCLMVNSHILSMRAEDCEGLAMLHPFQTDPAPGRRTARLADPSSQALSPSISLAKPIPTVLVTAYPDDGVRERAPSAGVIG